MVAVFNEYDKPLTGIVEQQGCHYFFDCFYGHIEGLSVWMYSLIQEDAAEAMFAANAEEFKELQSQAHRYAPARLVLAVEDLGIVSTSVLDSLAPEDVKRAIDELYESYREQTEQLARHRVEADDLKSTQTDNLIPA